MLVASVHVLATLNLVKHLVKSIPVILIQDRAPKTVSTYVRAYEAWWTWALVHLIQQGRSVSSINSAIYGASWVHKKSGYQQLSDHPLVQQVAEAARWILARPQEASGSQPC